jgi:hypothetical protein
MLDRLVPTADQGWYLIAGSPAAVYDEDEDAVLSIEINTLEDTVTAQFQDLFDNLCEATDWHIRLDWDGPDEWPDFPYTSKDRSPGQQAQDLWPAA